MGKVDAYIEHTPSGTYRIMCKRAKHKWWFELGKHAETDIEFERALNNGSVSWQNEIRDNTKIFQKK